VLTELDDAVTPPPDSLREAINLANANPDPDTITFNIVDAGGVGGQKTIFLSGDLPAIINPVVIDATTQKDFAGKPLIEVNAFGASNGFVINSANVTIRGFVLNNVLNDAIQISQGTSGAVTNVVVAGNYLGTNFDGKDDLGSNVGVHILDNGFGGASSVTIGGNTAADRNVIVGSNLHGIHMKGATVSNITIAGNYIGVGADGVTDVGNSVNGIFVEDGVTNCLIGGPTAGDRNVISGNDANGIRFFNATTVNNTVQGNYIGTNAAGTAGLLTSFGTPSTPIGDGIEFDNAKNSSVLGNVISNNGTHGITAVNSAANLTIRGNTIGLTADGSSKLGNLSRGINIFNSPTPVIGGPNPNDGNVVSGNVEGIRVDISSFSAIVQNNMVGTNKTGTAAIGNTSDGIRILNTSGAQVTNNLVSGNTGAGINIDNSVACKVMDNIVGLNAAKTAAIGSALNNNAGGIVLQNNNSQGATVTGNYVAGNTGGGIVAQNITAPGFQVVQFDATEPGGNDHYYVSTPSVFFDTAEAAAVAAGGHLVSISDAFENEFLFRNFTGSIGTSWIGLSDKPIYGGSEFGNTSGSTFDSSGVRGKGWKWTEGTTVDVWPSPPGYQAWGAGEPNNAGIGENNGQMQANGTWNDNGEITQPAILEFNVPPNLTTLAAALALTNKIENNFIGTDGSGTIAIGNRGSGIGLVNVNAGQAGGLSISNNVIIGSDASGIRAFNLGGTVNVYQWTTGPGANNHFYVLGPSTTWRVAEDTATKFGGHLVSIGSQDENNFVVNNIASFANANIWIGLTDDKFYGGVENGNTAGQAVDTTGARGKGFVWTDGTTLPPWPAPTVLEPGNPGYQSWAAGEPNNAGPNGSNENFVFMTTAGTWADVNAGGSNRTLFEFTTLPDLNALIGDLGVKVSITNNKIGTNAAGTALLGTIRGTGILLDATSAAVVTGNVIGGVLADGTYPGNGIRLNSAGVNRIQGNFIGTDATGAINLKNIGAGIALFGSNTNLIGSDLNGVNDAAEANIIRYNTGAGVELQAAVRPVFQFSTGPGANNHYYVVTRLTSSFVTANTLATSNSGQLVSITDAAENQFVNNVVRYGSGAPTVWIGLTDDTTTFGGLGTAEFGNTSAHSTDPLNPNYFGSDRGHGFKWTDGVTADVWPAPPGFQNWNAGEPNDAGGENFISMVNNGGWNDNNAGTNLRAVIEFTSPPSQTFLESLFPANLLPLTRNNRIRGNSIADNSGLGIDLGGDGITPNDVGDADSGVNNLLNFPTLSKTVLGTNTTAVGSYNGLANTMIAIDFYASAAADASGNGEGTRYLGSTTITTDGAGDATFSVNTLSSTASGEFVTAVAIDPQGNTSEFSKAFSPLPQVTSIVINDGSSQRSMITSITITFTQPVDFPAGIAAAFQVERTALGSLGNVGLTFNPPTGPASSVTITFNNAGTVGIDPAGSLADGKYLLTISADNVTGSGGSKFDGNGNGIAEGSPTDNRTSAFHRLFGDGTGDGNVNSTDFALFRTVFGVAGPNFDFDGSGVVNSNDFAEFRKRFGLSGYLP